jgi:hypothetical protein
MKKLFEFITDLVLRKNFYGKIIIGFQHGKVTLFEMRPTIDVKQFQD